MKRRKRFPPNVSEFEKPKGSGKFFLRWRKTGHATYYFKSKLGTPEFEVELDACRRGIAAPKVTIGARRYPPGTLAHAVLLYYSSTEFLSVRASTQKTYRGILDRFCKKYGDRSFARIERKHVKAILAGMADRPAAANKLLDRLRALMRFGMDMGLRKDDPTDKVKGFKLTGDGFHSWTDDEVAAFTKKHPAGTRAHLAFALLLYTGQRRSDVVKMGWQHISDGRIAVTQQKTGTQLRIKLHPELALVLKGEKRGNLTFLVTEAGAPFSAAGFGTGSDSSATGPDCRNAAPTACARQRASVLPRRGAPRRKFRRCWGTRACAKHRSTRAARIRNSWPTALSSACLSRAKAEQTWLPSQETVAKRRDKC